MAVYDCFPFFNENDLLELRLNQHWDFVDKFIITEAGETHTGLKKPFNFDHDRFKKYESKIKYVTFNSFEEEIQRNLNLLDEHSVSDRTSIGQHTEDWVRDHFQGNYPVKILRELDAQDEDIIYISALDEILSNKGFTNGLQIFEDKGKRYHLRMSGIPLYREEAQPVMVRPIFGFKLDMYAYKFNLFSTVISGPAMTEWQTMSRNLPSTTRSLAYDTHDPVVNAGWHFTFLDDTDGEKILAKYKSWAHSRDRDTLNDLSNADYSAEGCMYFDIQTKEEAVERMLSIYKPNKVDISEDTHPIFLVNNLDQYGGYIL